MLIQAQYCSFYAEMALKAVIIIIDGYVRQLVWCLKYVLGGQALANDVDPDQAASSASFLFTAR